MTCHLEMTKIWMVSIPVGDPRNIILSFFWQEVCLTRKRIRTFLFQNSDDL